MSTYIFGCATLFSLLVDGLNVALIEMFIYWNNDF